MAGILKPAGVGEEVGYKVWGELLVDPSSILFNESYTTPTRPYAYWSSASHFLDIEFYQDVRIHDAGGSVSGYSNPLKIYDNANGVKGAYIKDLLANNFSVTPNWTIVAELPKGRYRIEYGVGYRISNEWYLESFKKHGKSFILSGDGYKKLSEGTKGIQASNGTATSIPIMTSNTVPSGVVRSDTNYPTFEPWLAVDGKINGAGWVSIVGKRTGWWEYEFEKPKIIYKYTINVRDHSDAPTESPRNFTFQGWNGLEWVILDTRTNENWIRNQKKEFIIVNPIACIKYRIDITLNNGNVSYTGFSEVEMMEKILYSPATPSSWKTVSSTLPTLPQFQSEGMDDLSIFDRKVQPVLESPQEMTSSELGEGKVFRGTVDLKKYFDLRKLEVK